ncbi:MAG: response regulator [Bacteroidia bacterium]|nr:response regulator [Bacteroidia bacterium]
MIDPSFKKANIMIVDDQEANIDVLEGFLEIQGYNNLKTITDPRTVVELYKSFKPDLILLDLTMPYLTGFEVMDQLKNLIQENTFLPILVLTADITNETKLKALSGGASDFLTKPFNLLEVGLRIKNLLLSSYLQQQLMNQNKILDEKVNDRTKELVEKNRELSGAKEKAEASDRLKSSFINNISHEIRTPLNGILGFGQMLTNPDLNEEEKNQYLEILNESSERLIKTVTNFLEISMVSSGNQEMDLKDIHPEFVINDIAKQFYEPCANKNIRFNVEQLPAIQQLKIHSDSLLLTKILRHLLDNAVKFTDSGSITLRVESKENELLFSIKDTGKGISDEGKKLIFNSFMQEDNSYTRSYQGCGLGLSIAKGLIELLGGTIWVESEQNIGSTFFFTIPIRPVAEDRTEITRPDKKENCLKSILVAEDDEINFLYINILLKNPFIQIIRATNGEEAVNLFKAHPEICAVLTDLKMPVMDGYKAARAIKNLRSDVPILAITAYSGNEDKQRALDSGCDEFITKPINKELLLEKLAKYGIIISSISLSN